MGPIPMTNIINLFSHFLVTQFCFQMTHILYYIQIIPTKCFIQFAVSNTHLRKSTCPEKLIIIIITIEWWLLEYQINNTNNDMHKYVVCFVICLYLINDNYDINFTNEHKMMMLDICLLVIYMVILNKSKSIYFINEAVRSRFRSRASCLFFI